MKLHNFDLAELHNIYGIVLGLLRLYIVASVFRMVIMQFAQLEIKARIKEKFVEGILKN